MSLTSYRTAPPRVRCLVAGRGSCHGSPAGHKEKRPRVTCCSVLGRPGSDRLSQVLRLSTIGAEGFNGRVRNGIGFGPLAWATRPAKPRTCFVILDFSVPHAEHGPGKWSSGLWRRPCSRQKNRWPDPGGIWRRALMKKSDQANRAISTGKLHALPRFHTRPINVVVFHGSQGKTRFEGGFPLRCLQRLSRPHIATLLCRWRDNRSTRGASIPVLSY